jgi:diaminopimelate decarboxylase
VLALAPRIGLRINPQASTKAGLSITSSAHSKFGVCLRDERAAIIAAYTRYRWLNGIHCHCGSQEGESTNE